MFNELCILPVRGRNQRKAGGLSPHPVRRPLRPPPPPWNDTSYRSMESCQIKLRSAPPLILKSGRHAPAPIRCFVRTVGAHDGTVVLMIIALSYIHGSNTLVISKSFIGFSFVLSLFCFVLFCFRFLFCFCFDFFFSIIVFAGVGHGLPIVAKVIVLKDYFKDNFAMATGVAFSGGALGMIVFAPVMEMGIATYGWRGTMFLFGALNLNMCVAGALMIPPVTAKSNTQSKINKNIFETDKEDKPCIGFLSTISDYLGVDVLLESPITAIYFAAFSLHAITLIGWITFLVSYTISIGYSNQTASYLSALAGVGALFGRIMYAPLVDGGVISGRVMFCLLAIGGALSVASYPFTDQYWVLSIISVLTGVFLSSAPPVYIIVLHELFPDDQGTFSSAVGLHYMARGLGRLVGGPLTGKIENKYVFSSLSKQLKFVIFSALWASR